MNPSARVAHAFGRALELGALGALAATAVTDDARAAELPEFYYGARATAMGNAYTAVADDADAVFYNPAGLALHESFRFNLVNPKFEIAHDIIALTDPDSGITGKFDGSTISKVFGKHVYGKGSIFPNLHFPNFILGYYLGYEGRLLARNLSLPYVEGGYFRDRGVVTGFGYEVRGFSKRHFLRFGFTVKWITREGFNKVLELVDLATIDKSYLSKLRQGPGSGIGGGFGLQYEMPVTRMNNLVLAAAWQDIGDTTFGTRLSGANRPPAIRNNLAAGFAFIHMFSPSFRNKNNWKLSGEMRHLMERGKDLRLKVHVGSELQLGFVSVQVGLNQDSWTAGLGLKLGILDLAASTYGVEQQTLAFMDRERRYMLQLSFALDMMGGKGQLNTRTEDRRKRPRSY